MVSVTSHTDSPVIDHLPPGSRDHMGGLCVNESTLGRCGVDGSTVVVKETGKTETNEPQEGLVEVEEIGNVSLAPGEQRTVSEFLCATFLVLILLTRQKKIPISVKSLRPTKVALTELTYKFLVSIPCLEPLSTRGQ